MILTQKHEALSYFNIFSFPFGFNMESLGLYLWWKKPYRCHALLSSSTRQVSIISHKGKIFGKVFRFDNVQGSFFCLNQRIIPNKTKTKQSNSIQFNQSFLESTNVFGMEEYGGRLDGKMVEMYYFQHIPAIFTTPFPPSPASKHRVNYLEHQGTFESLIAPIETLKTC